MATINFEDKTDGINIPQYPDTQKILADNLNEIKKVVNQNFEDQEQTNDNIQGTFNSVNTDISLVKQEIGFLDQLQTTAKGSLVSAVNELVEKINSISVGTSFYYPIGTILFNENKDFNPNDLYIGTWERIKGKLIFGVDEADNDFSTSGKTGGEKEHNHVENVFAYNGNLAVSNTDFAAETSKSMIYTVNGTTGFTYISGTQTVDAYRTEKSSNMPPYQTAYIWERTA